MAKKVTSKSVASKASKALQDGRSSARTKSIAASALSQNSTEEIKGSDCVDQFRAMQECMQKYPDLYPQEDENEEKEKSSKDLEATPVEDSVAKEEKGSS